MTEHNEKEMNPKEAAEHRERALEFYRTNTPLAQARAEYHKANAEAAMYELEMVKSLIELQMIKQGPPQREEKPQNPTPNQGMKVNND